MGPAVEAGLMLSVEAIGAVLLTPERSRKCIGETPAGHHGAIQPLSGFSPFALTM
jgi:hypothetical protein